MNRKHFEEVEHTADWALHVRGKNLEELLYTAAVGMLELAGAEAQDGPGKKRLIELKAPDRESLLVAWLEEILFAMETREVMPIDISVQIKCDEHLYAQVEEKPYQGLKKHIKAVTFHNLVIKQTEDGFEATVVFDV